MFRRDRWWNREIERRERDWATERAELVATICHLAGKPQTRTVERPEPVEPPPVADRWTLTPEQLPV